MHIARILAQRQPTLSLEFFPPKTPPGWERLFRIISKFESLKPDFVSVTYGAGGSTREQTHELVRRIRTETSVEPVPHLTCVCHERAEVEAILAQYAGLDIGGIMTLGGDRPLAPGGEPASAGGKEGDAGCSSDYQHAIDLVRHIRVFNESGAHPGGGFGIGVAGFPEGHPATPNRMLEMDYLKSKVDAGADYICTQLFFDNRDFLDFRDRCVAAGITVPVIAGIMPVVSRANYERIPSLALGSRYPAALIRRLAPVHDDGEVRRIGVEWAQAQCEDLVRNEVHGIHFYTLNRFAPIREVWSAVR